MPDSPNSLKEILDQTSQVATDPVFGSRTLDLGSIFPNPASSSVSPLASSIGSIPSYTPPPQQGGGTPPSQVEIPKVSEPKPIGYGGISNGLSGGGSINNPFTTLPGLSKSFSSPSGSGGGFGFQTIGSLGDTGGTLVSGGGGENAPSTENPWSIG